GRPVFCCNFRIVIQNLRSSIILFTGYILTTISIINPFEFSINKFYPIEEKPSIHWEESPLSNYITKIFRPPII
ncbi:MAG: hypothetical protein WCK82_14355, partial [Bacteroidota bacterium]